MAVVLDVAAGDAVIDVVPCIYIKKNVCTLLFLYVPLGLYGTFITNIGLVNYHWYYSIESIQLKYQMKLSQRVWRIDTCGTGDVFSAI